MTRVVEPGATRDFSERNDEAFVAVSVPDHADLTPAEAVRVTPVCQWCSEIRFAERNKSSTSCLLFHSVDCLPMVHQRHPVVAATLVAQLRRES